MASSENQHWISDNAVFHAYSHGTNLSADKNRTFKKKENKKKNIRIKWTGFIADELALSAGGLSQSAHGLSQSASG